MTRYVVVDNKIQSKIGRAHLLSKSLNGKLIPVGSSIPSDASLVFIQGIKRGALEMIHEMQDRGVDYIYIDNTSFLEYRTKRFRFVKNGFYNTEIDWDVEDNELMKRNFEPWRKEDQGEYVLILQPSGWVQKLTKTEGWLDKTLERYKDHKVVVRKKPKVNELGIGLKEQLDKAYLLVTHSSSVVLDALQLGIRIDCSEHGPTGIHINNRSDFDRAGVFNSIISKELTYEQWHHYPEECLTFVESIS